MHMEPKLGPIGQIARSVDDIEEAVRWYGQVLGLPLLYRFEGMAFFDLGGTRLYLQQNPRWGPESILYFRVPDILASHAALAGKGVVFSRPPHPVHRHEDGSAEWLAFFDDPQGRPLALMALQRP